MIMNPVAMERIIITCNHMSTTVLHWNTHSSTLNRTVPKFCIISQTITFNNWPCLETLQVNNLTCLLLVRLIYLQFHSTIYSIQILFYLMIKHETKNPDEIFITVSVYYVLTSLTRVSNKKFITMLFILRMIQVLGVRKAWIKFTIV
jgi:hypothetical protein